MTGIWQRLCAVVAVIAFMASLTAHGVTAMPVVDGMSETMAMAQTFSDACDDGDCAAHDVSAVCYAVWCGSIAVPAGPALSHIADGRSHGSWASPAQLGHTSPPDPFPPRAAVLS